MTEKEFRKLRTLDLIQILLTQSNEETRLREELDRQKEHLEGLRTHNEDLKTALNDKDALIEELKRDLNQSDAMIHDLREELKALYTDKRINLENIGSLTEVAKRVNQIFETAQREAEEYLAHPERVYSIEEGENQESIVPEEETRNDLENIESDEVVRNLESSVIDSVDTDDIKVEVAINGTEAADDITSEPVIFEASDHPVKTAALEPGTKENTDEVSDSDTADGTAETANATGNLADAESANVTDSPTVTVSTETADDIAEETAEASIESVDEAVTAEAEDKPVESVTPGPADSDALTAELAVSEADTASAEIVTAETTDIKTDKNSVNTAENVSSPTTAAVNNITEAVAEKEAGTTAKKAETHHVKTTSKNSRQSKSLFQKFIGGIKREKAGR